MQTYDGTPAPWLSQLMPSLSRTRGRLLPPPQKGPHCLPVAWAVTGMGVGAVREVLLTKSAPHPPTHTHTSDLSQSRPSQRRQRVIKPCGGHGRTPSSCLCSQRKTGTAFYGAERSSRENMGHPSPSGGAPSKDPRAAGLHSAAGAAPPWGLLEPLNHPPAPLV